ncbi:MULTISPECIES: ABC transporter ATP-binding protein [Pseudomonas]|uniref:ABC transporter ATP-binding protein n=1 Tax=Pseudomonas nitroreducens TaxID=46680 RepID=UPI00147E86B6|nr:MULTISPECIES: ABC transporter ATP-binding protein [Pseudomonas]NNN25289.1 ABC transporter ATP-binding protein [Pseudomonas nitroreducens]
MSSEQHNDMAIKIEGLSKCYHIYDQPRDRLKQMILPRLQRAIGMQPRQYFREFWALQDVSFEVRKGETVGIVGRNGSGKSTLLQMICGTLNPTHGTVQTNGRIAALLELGSGFNPEFTGRENVYLNGAVLGLSREEIDSRFDEIVGFADIGDFIEQPVKTYSSGMMVRLAFAVAVNVAPDILIVDEALAVGDWLFQKRCFQKIEQLAANGTTLLFVSHDQESVRTLTNRALLLAHGKSLAWGTSSEVVLEYRKLLHDEESAYFTALLSETTADTPSSTAVPAETPAKANNRSELMEFGDGHARIVGVRVLNSEGEECSSFYPGEQLRINVRCQALSTARNLNVAIRLRNKEGVKVYSWGTLNQDISRYADGSARDIFWEKNFHSNEEFSVDFLCDCPLGMNLYEVQACLSFEATPDYLQQRILHWIDEAAFFKVLVRKEAYFFGGICDLRMNATWD